MKYRSYLIEFAKKYIIFAIMCVLYWLYRNGTAIGKNIDEDMISSLVGLNNGYSYQWIIATVFLLGYIFVLNKGINFFSVPFVIRKPRDSISKRNIVSVIVNSLCYVSIYISVEAIFVLNITEPEVLVNTNYFIALFLFGVSLVLVYSIMGMLYLMIFLVTENSYLSMIILFVISILIVFAESYLYIGLFEIYTNMGVIDQIVGGYGANLLKWGILSIVQMMIIGILCVIVREKYIRKDILNKDAKK